MNTRRATDLIESNLERMGLDVDRDYSGSSNSQYLIIGKWVIEGYDEDGDPIEDKVEYKIRISDHPLPPTYHILNGSADYDVSTGGIHEDCHTTEWFGAVFWAAQKYGLEVPSAVKGAKTRHEKTLAEAEERRQQWQEEQRARQAKHEQDRLDILKNAKALGGRAAELAECLEKTDKRLADMLVGGHGSKARQNLRKRAKGKERELRELLNV